jgi:hypothetical protein
MNDFPQRLNRKYTPVCGFAPEYQMKRLGTGIGKVLNDWKLTKFYINIQNFAPQFEMPAFEPPTVAR